MALLVASGPLLAAEPIIAAAADLKFALEEVAKSFQKDSGQSVKLILLFFFIATQAINTPAIGIFNPLNITLNPAHNICSTHRPSLTRYFFAVHE